jgi:hypothetical protein
MFIWAQNHAKTNETICAYNTKKKNSFSISPLKEQLLAWREELAKSVMGGGEFIMKEAHLNILKELEENYKKSSEQKERNLNEYSIELSNKIVENSIIKEQSAIAAKQHATFLFRTYATCLVMSFVFFIACSVMTYFLYCLKSEISIVREKEAQREEKHKKEKHKKNKSIIQYFIGSEDDPLTLTQERFPIRGRCFSVDNIVESRRNLNQILSKNTGCVLQSIQYNRRESSKSSKVKN